MSDSIANGFFRCGSSNPNITVVTSNTQWVGQTGSTIYYEPYVGIGSSATPTSTLQVTGNVYASNAVTAGYFYGDGRYLTNVGGGVSSQWTGTTGNPITYVPYVGIGSPDLPTANLSVSGNVYVSNAVTTTNVNVSNTLEVTGAMISNVDSTVFLFDTFAIPYIVTDALLANAVTSNDTTTANLTVTNKLTVANLFVTGNVYVSNALVAANAYISNIFTSNIVGFVGSQWTGTTGGPITYVPQVGIGSSAVPTANLQVTGNLYVTTTIQYGEDLVRRAPHLVPSVANAGVITAWVSGTCNAVAVQSSFWASASVPTVSNIAIGPPGLDSYTGSVLLNNGRVLFVPSAASSGIGLFNPSTDQYSVVTPAGSTLTGGYSGGVLVPNGNVVFVSNTATSIGVYNPMTLTFSSAPAHNCATPAFFGGTLGPNSNVIMVPSTGHSNIGEYSPTTGLYSNMVPTGTLGGYAGAVLIPNGNVVCVPWNSGRIGQYDAVNRVFSNSATVVGQFAGGVLAPNGTVVCVPSTLSNVVVFDPVTNAASNIIAASGFFGGVLMPTGNIVCVPSTNSNVGWIDPIRLTYSNIVPQSAFGANAFRGGTLLPDGRVIFCPYDATNVAGIQSLTPAPVEFCRSPYFNKF
jgi:hypothetical protein